MKLKRPTSVYIWGYIIAMPFVAIAFNHILYDERAKNEWQVWVYSTALLFGIGFFSWYSQVQYEFLVQQM